MTSVCTSTVAGPMRRGVGGGGGAWGRKWSASHSFRHFEKVPHVKQSKHYYDYYKITSEWSSVSWHSGRERRAAKGQAGGAWGQHGHYWSASAHKHSSFPPQHTSAYLSAASQHHQHLSWSQKSPGKSIGPSRFHERRHNTHRHISGWHWRGKRRVRTKLGGEAGVVLHLSFFALCVQLNHNKSHDHCDTYSW